MKKRLLSCLLVLSMLFPLLPLKAEASEASAESAAPGQEETVREIAAEPEVLDGASRTPVATVKNINPLYADLYSEENLPESSVSAKSANFLSTSSPYENLGKAGAAIRQYMVKRQAEFSVSFYTESCDYEAMFDTLINAACDHTGVPNEGDYLFWHYGGATATIYGYDDSNGRGVVTYDISMLYNSSAADEAEVDAKVASLISELGLKSKYDYYKVKAIYDWICSNIVYDHVNVNETFSHTCYAALINHTAVCQGYALLFYRLALEVGVDARLISGDAPGGRHGWNIVNLDDSYYYLDSTWDAGNTAYGYDYFLRGAYYFPDHYDDYKFTTTEFYNKFPVSSYDYTRPAAPSLISGPASKTVNEGQTATFSVSYSGTGRAQWQYLAPGGSWKDTGGNSKTLNVTASAAKNGYQYRCVVKNSAAGVTTSAAKLTVRVAPSGFKATSNTDGSIKLSWDAVSGAAKYEVYRASSKSGTYTKISTQSGTSVTSANNIVPGKIYYYKVRALDANGTAGPYSAVKSCVCRPDQPVITLSNVSSTGKIKISWPKVEGAAKYEVYRAASKSGTYTKISTQSGTSVTSSNSIVPGKIYYYKVRAVTENGYVSAYSAVKSCVCRPARPVITLENVASTGKIKISWPKVDGAAKYEVYRASSKSGTYTKISTQSSTSVTNSNGLVPGKTYYYKVRAVTENGYVSAYSEVKYRACRPSRPVITLSNVASSGKINISWPKVDGAAKYEVYRASSKSGTYTKISTQSGTSVTSSSSIVPGKTYYYKVRAVTENGYLSAYSEVKYRVCDCARPVVSIGLNSGKPRLSWAAVEGADSYKIYRSTSASGTYSLLKTVSGTSFTNTGAESGKTYYYKVKAVSSLSSSADSAYSSVVSAKAK